MTNPRRGGSSIIGLGTAIDLRISILGLLVALDWVVVRVDRKQGTESFFGALLLDTTVVSQLGEKLPHPEVTCW